MIYGCEVGITLGQLPDWLYVLGMAMTRGPSFSDIGWSRIVLSQLGSESKQLFR